MLKEDFEIHISGKFEDLCGTWNVIASGYGVTKHYSVPMRGRWFEACNPYESPILDTLQSIPYDLGKSALKSDAE